ncbi:MAG: PLP-dependent aminotransferase family protein [Steroidobacteraceae bacterium]
MQLPLGLDANARASLQAQIFEQVRNLIVDGRLQPGARMPATRILASDLGVSRNTVVLAYERLAAEGFVEMRSPIGVFVARNVIFDSPRLPEASIASGRDGSTYRDRRIVFRGESHTVAPSPDASIRYDYWVGRPDATLFPAKAWERILHQTLQEHGPGVSAYCDPAGLLELRRAVAQYVGVARGIRARPDQILITSGIQEALNVLARLFIGHGTEVAVEYPCYSGAANVFTSYGARLATVNVDREGVDTSRLPADIAFIYVTPSHQFPTGATLPVERRAQLVDWAERAGAYVLEDDYDSDFYYDSAPLPALKSMDETGRVVYLGTFSKSLGAGLRIGYMVLPDCLVEAATVVKALLDNCSPWLPQKLLAEFVTSGAFAHHLRRTRTIYRDRRDCLLEVLREHFGDLDVSGSQGGMHVMWRLPEDFPDASTIQREARRRGVGVYDLLSCNVRVRRDDHLNARSLLLGYATLDEDAITDSIALLANAIQDGAAECDAACPQPWQRSMA